MKFIMLAVFFFCACERSTTSITGLVCTEAEAERVKSETLFCNSHGEYMAADCYRSAMNRICKPREGVK